MATPASAAPIDESVVIPRAVLAAREAADRMQREAIEARNAPPPQSDAPPDTPITQDPPVPPVTQEVAPPQNDNPPGESWEHKIASANGRYAAEVKRRERLQQQVDELNADNDAMRAHIRTLELQIRTPAPAKEPAPVQRLTTDEDRETYGDDLLDLVARRAVEAVSPKLAELEEENANLRRQVGSVGEKFVMDAREKLYQTLDKEQTEWRTTNQSEGFLDWLALPDPYTGVNRKSLMMQAFERNDAPRVLAFFRGFHAEVAATAPAGSRTDEEANASGKVPLESLAAPGRAKSAAAPTGAPSEKPTYTRAQIGQFYRDVRDGKYRGREAEQANIEADIFTAGPEGRIR